MPLLLPSAVSTTNPEKTKEKAAEEEKEDEEDDYSMDYDDDDFDEAVGDEKEKEEQPPASVAELYSSHVAPVASGAASYSSSSSPTYNRTMQSNSISNINNYDKNIVSNVNMQYTAATAARSHDVAASKPNSSASSLASSSSASCDTMFVSSNAHKAFTSYVYNHRDLYLKC